MNLGQLATFVCTKIGQIDAASLAACKTFINARYEMIYDSYAWRDSESTAAVTMTSEGIMNIPPDMTRVIAIRSNGDTFLDPVNVNLLMQTDPSIFERRGLPTVYREFTPSIEPSEIMLDTPSPVAINKKIQVYPRPTGDVPFLVVGKRTLVDLTGNTDVPVIRNIDNVLIAYAEGDMWERQRQVGKAQAKFVEAGAMLTAAQQLESGQANQPRQSKQLTVSGNSLAELVDAVCARTGDYSLPSVVLAKEFLRRQYQRVWDACNWSESTVQATVNNDGGEIVLPVYFDRIISIRGNSGQLQMDAIEPSYVFGVAPNLFEQTGAPIGFNYLTPVGVAILPPQREALEFISSAAADKSKIFVMGESNGSEASETVTLNGIQPVQTRTLYDTPITVAKSLTVGNITVTGKTTGYILQTLLSSERERKHIRLWLQPTPSSAQVCLILGKRRIKPLVTDEDTPLLRDVQATLIAAATADMFMKMGNTTAATDARGQADSALKTLIDLETSQGAYSATVIPYTEPCYDDYSWGDITSKYG